MEATTVKEKNAITSQLRVVSLSQIDTDFVNSRTTMNEETINALAASIDATGLINPICLHEKEQGRYSVIAGFTRFEAIKRLKREEVEAKIFRGLTEHQKIEVNLSENTVRSDLTISQQLLSLKRIMTEMATKDARTLGARLMWSTKRVNDLIKISKLPLDALTALEQGKIKIGHAVVMSQMMELGNGDLKENCKLITKTITDIQVKGWSVNDLKEKVIARQVPLKIAKFDTEKHCDGCEYNSDTFGDLFTERSGSGLCSKPACFKEKSEAYLADVVSEAEQRFGQVIVVSSLAKSEVSYVNKDLLGEAQVNQCEVCNDNVAIVNDLITSKTFCEVKHNICRNKTCFSRCAETFKEESEKGSKDEELSVQVELTANKADDQSSPYPTKNKPQEVATSAVNLGKLSGKQMLLSQKKMAMAMLEDINQAEVTKLIMSFALEALTGKRTIFDAISTNQEILGDDAKRAIGGSYKNLVSYLKKEVKSEHLNKTTELLLGLLANYSKRDELITKSWDYKEFLSTYTIKGIIALCRESGFVKFFGEDKFQKISSYKRADLIKEIIKADWNGWDDYKPLGHSEANHQKTFIKK